MPKGQFYNPDEIRQRGYLDFTPIPLLQYKKTMGEELAEKHFSPQNLVGIYEHMRWIRVFETMLLNIRNNGTYGGVSHKYKGPAHLYIGQEAVAVGQSYFLKKEDFIFGNHRSHGETIAKGLKCIETMEEEELLKVMENTCHGMQYEVVKARYPKADVRSLAVKFFFYGLICELFGRENGFSKSLANSMHLFFTPFGIYPNNAIVGGSVGIAVGGALYKHIRGEKGVCIANFGDGALGCGPVWEAMNFACMDQFQKLWQGKQKGGLPILFNIINNGYGMGGQTNGETMGYETLARVGAGLTPSQMHSERIDGMNPLAVIDAYRRKLPLLKSGEGPVLLDVLTYRFCGHSVSDHGSYRTEQEVDAWKKHDGMKAYEKELIDFAIATKKQLRQMDKEIEQTIREILTLAVDEKTSSFLKTEKIGTYLFSNQKKQRMKEGNCHTLCLYEENERVQLLEKKDRKTEITYGDGLFEAILQKFYVDPTLIAYGQENRDWGGQFGVYQGMTQSLPYYRLFNAPISEAAIVATGVGYGICGGRCVIDLAYCDFMGRAGDEIFNQLAKWQGMSGGVLRMPVVVRVSLGSQYGAQHSQDWTSICAHIPGLKVVFPATPYDAKGLMNSALQGTDPIIFFESQKLYDKTEAFCKDGVPKEYYEVPIGVPNIKQVGKDITILTLGATLYEAKKAADCLKEKWNIEAELIDGRSLVPFDYEVLLQSVKKTGRLLLAGDACERGSYLNHIARTVTELCFKELKAPPVVLGARNWIVPCFEFEEAFFPQATWMIDAIHEKLMELSGHICEEDLTEETQMIREKSGL